MWVTTHVLAGLGIAAALGGPWWLLVVLVIAAHILMDLIPHWDYTISRHPVFYGWCDFIASFAAFWIAWLLLGYPWWIAFMGLISGRAGLGRAHLDRPGREGAQVLPESRGLLPARQVRTGVGHRRPGGHHGSSARPSCSRCARERPCGERPSSTREERR